jgi:hypothetical protein
MVSMGDVNLTFDDGSVVRLHLAPIVKEPAALGEFSTGQAERDESLELPSGFGAAQPVSVQGRVAQALTRGGEALTEALRPLGGVLDGIHQSLAESAQRPDEVTVEFGVTLGSDLSLGVFSGKGEASFTVSASWHFTSGARTEASPETPLPVPGAAASTVS